MGNKRSLKYETPQNYTRMQVGLLSTQTISRKKLLLIRNSLVLCSKATRGTSFHNLLTVHKYAIFPAITYASEACTTTISKRAKSGLRQTQISFLIFKTKPYRTVSNDARLANAGIITLAQAMHLYQDTRAISRGQHTKAVILD